MAVRQLFFVWLALPVLHAGAVTTPLCTSSRHLLDLADRVPCTAMSVDELKTMILFNGAKALAFAAFFVVTGVGLWRTWRRAYGWVIGAYILNAAFSVRWLLIESVQGLGSASSELKHSMDTWLAIEVFIVLALLYSTGVRESLAEEA